MQVKKILVIRTDRIGEVLLSTPILTALKEKWPLAEITVMARPEVKELIEDNPRVSEIIEYEEEKGEIKGNKGREGGIGEAFRLREIFKKRKFDIAIVVNPKREFHLAVFLAGIPVRAGFDRKWAFFLTHKAKDLKFLARRHEVEYNLDLVRALGIEPKDKRPVLVVKNKMTPSDHPRPLIAIHPCTSNPEKQWPPEYFSRLGDLLAEAGYGVAVVGGAENIGTAREVISRMRHKPLDLVGKTSLRELALFLKGCDFLVSGDSGPVHIASAFGTKVIALFGSADPGSKPRRWGPYGEGHTVIEKKRIEDILPSEVMAEIHSRDWSQPK